MVEQAGSNFLEKCAIANPDPQPSILLDAS